MNITVIGGGNIGTQFAVHSSDKGHSVKMFTSNPSRFSKHLFIVDNCNNKTRIKICDNTVLENFPLYCPKCKREIIWIPAKIRNMS